MSTETKSATDKQPTQEDIAICAYLIWESEGRPEGRDVNDWLQAEVQLHVASKLDQAETGKP